MLSHVEYRRGELKAKLKPGEITRLLDAKGLRRPYRELAKTLGCSHNIVGEYLNNSVKSPSLDMVVKWATYLGVSVEDLIIIEEEETDEGEGNRQRPPAHISEREARLPLLSLP